MVRFPVWHKMFISLFKFFSYSSVIFYGNSTSKTMPFHAPGNNWSMQRHGLGSAVHKKITLEYSKDPNNRVDPNYRVGWKTDP